MAPKTQQRKERDGAISTLNGFIEVLNLAKEVASITPAKAAFGSASVLLTMIKDCMANDQDYVGLGSTCVDICKALERGISGKTLDDLSRSVCEAIDQLKTTVEEIQRRVTKQSKRSRVSRLFYAKSNKDKIAGWRTELNGILHVFHTELAINTNVAVTGMGHNVENIQNIVSDMHRVMVKIQDVTNDPNQPTQARVHGESPPPPPRACFGRNEFIEEVANLADGLEPVALIGAGGIGKTSIALAVLHHDRIKRRFGENRRFIRCDKFPASLPHFLSQLSNVIGAGLENPKGLDPLRPFLSSTEMILLLDNAESILDPQGTDAREIYMVVEELGCFSNICLCITSRIFTVPPHFKRPVIPTLSVESACDIFYSICDNGGRSDIISDLVSRLDFHALSITLLATAAAHNVWDYKRLAKEWDTQRGQVLQTDYNESLSAAIELSLASPTFRKLGPQARDLLGVVAFFPQGIDENNVDWLFPTLPDRKRTLDKFCTLSLACRSDGFITMLAPIRDYLRPQPPESSPLLLATKDHYFTRLAVKVDPNAPVFEEARWIRSEDVNVEHLLNIFISVDVYSAVILSACDNFMKHLYWHKSRYTILGSKIEGFADDHPFKLEGLFQLSQLIQAVGNYAERRRLLVYALKLARERKDDIWIARILERLSDANRVLDLHKEGIKQAREALKIYEWLGDILGQAVCWGSLAWLLHKDDQLDAAEQAAVRAIELLPKEGEEFEACQSHRALGQIYHSKGEKNRAIYHFEVALEIASTSKWNYELFWIRLGLAQLFLIENELDDANTQIERTKSHAVDNAYYTGLAMTIQAWIWFRQCRLGDATSEARGAFEIFEKIGASQGLSRCKDLLWEIEQASAPAHSSPPNAPPPPVDTL